MLINKATFSVNNIFSYASRKRCLDNMNKLQIPGGWTPTGTASANASVLIPVCSIKDSTSLLYTIRSQELRSHSGQISFPGGKLNEGESPIQAALRETREEIGLAPAKVDVWGHGTPIPGRDRKILITPVIGAISNIEKHDINVNYKEVSEVFTIPLEMLCDPKNQFYTQFKNGFVLPVFVAENYKIWGVTAYLTHIFLNSLLPKEVYKNEWMKKRIEIEDTGAMFDTV